MNKMKKKVLLLILLSIITFSIAIVLILPLFNTEPDDEGKIKDEFVPQMVISSFESLEEMRNFNYYNTFGRVELSEKYKTVGDYSAELEIHGSTLKADPKMDVYTDTIYFNKQDFTQLTSLQFDVYNPDQTEHKMYFSFTTRLSGDIRSAYSEKEYTLKSGWNNINYVIDRQVAQLLCYMNSMEYFSFKFQRESTPYKIYIDNFVANFTELEIEPLVKEYNPNEILAFNQKVDRFMVVHNLNLSVSSQAPTISTNRNPKYIKEGDGSLQLDVKIAPNRPNFDGDFPGLYVTKENLPTEDFTGYKSISMWIYNSGLKTRRIYFGITDQDGNYNLGAYKDVPSKMWTLIEVDIALLSKDVALDGTDKPSLDISKISNLSITYDNVTSGEVFQFYFDDLKFNK